MYLKKKIITTINYPNWSDIVSETQIIKNYILKEGNFKVYGKQASSSTANKLYHNSCLAIGNAAIAFDPISSHGYFKCYFLCFRSY